MKKFYIKHKVWIFQTIIAGIITRSIFEWFPKLIFNNKSIILFCLEKVLSFSVNIKIYQILLFLILSTLISSIYRKIIFQKNKLKIIEAKYFTDDSHSFNITNELNSSIEEDKLKIVLSNNIAGDPNFGVVKEGIVKYKWNNNIETKNYKEGELIDLP